ncbi:hypothetical protein SAMN05421594_3516 [Chryseobacterium oleae]|uniref:Uncharacterized protein n=1 Tax=Chryseobacterium oleae TaxID=491207 RepID=A0A1I5AE99_CHROL|nr:hypothetical protein SAMN05421594_3516 [Chryseobacterium oleae]
MICVNEFIILLINIYICIELIKKLVKNEENKYSFSVFVVF